MIDSNDEGYADTDGDGMADNSESTDSPNSDVTEDLDDGIPNFLDLDSDDTDVTTSLRQDSLIWTETVY